MNNHVQINPAHKRPGLTQPTTTDRILDADCRRQKVVMPTGAWLAITGVTGNRPSLACSHGGSV